MQAELAELQKSLTLINSRLDGMENVWRTMQGKGAFAEDAELTRLKAELEKAQKQMQEPYGEFSLRSLMPTKADLPMVAAGLGSASAGTVAGFVMRFIPAEGFFGIRAATLAQLVGGWLIYKFGARWSQYISAFGGGVIIRAIGEAFEGFGFSLGSITGGLGLGAPASSPARTPAASVGGIVQP